MVSIYAPVKLPHGEKVHQLGEYQSSCVHRPFPLDDFQGLWPKIGFQVDANLFVGKFISCQAVNPCYLNFLRTAVTANLRYTATTAKLESGSMTARSVKGSSGNGAQVLDYFADIRNEPIIVHEGTQSFADILEKSDILLFKTVRRDEGIQVYRSEDLGTAEKRYAQDRAYVLHLKGSCQILFNDLPLRI